MYAAHPTGSHSWRRRWRWERTPPKHREDTLLTGNVSSVNSEELTSPGNEGVAALHRQKGGLGAGTCPRPRSQQLVAGVSSSLGGYQMLHSSTLSAALAGVAMCGGRGNGKCSDSRPGCPTGGSVPSRAWGGEPGREEPKGSESESLHASVLCPSPFHAPLCHWDWCWGHSGSLEPEEGAEGAGDRPLSRALPLTPTEPQKQQALLSPSSAPHTSQQPPGIPLLSAQQSHLCQELGRGPGRCG